MSNYYILSVESLIQTFTPLDSGKRITFELTSQENSAPFKDIQNEDIILGYIGSPVSQIRLALKVADTNGTDQIELIKTLEAEDGVSVKDETLEDEIAKEGLVEIDKAQFKAIYEELIENQRAFIKKIAGDNTSKPVKILDKYDSLSEIPVTAAFIGVPYNYLVFGAPGTGKSWQIKELQKKHFAEKERYERITFYHNYSYANFVGTYKPKMKGDEIIYGYVPGPFTRILEKAYKNPDKNYLLIVEEINRANPAAVFGDAFQLLDREEGKSEYPIQTSEDMRRYLAQRFIPDFEDMKEKEEEILQKFSELHIPSNMYIWATMNSADQGVFPMDTAFKRRWEYDYIGIDENSTAMENVCFMAPDKTGGQVKVNWNKLRQKINETLSGSSCKVNEDKLIGPYFISSELMQTNPADGCVTDNERFLKVFKSKVLMYLYEDAAKNKASIVFQGCSDTSRYSSVCSEFDQKGVAIFGEDTEKNVLTT